MRASDRTHAGREASGQIGLMNQHRRMVMASLIGVAALLLLAEPALAQATSSGGYQTVLSAVRGFLKFLTGPFGKAIASIGLIICGIGWVAGKMNIAWLLYVVVGAAIIFGAEQIIDSIASGGGQL
jgi:type IV secretion system protein VirB2